MSMGFILLGITHSRNDARHQCMHGTTKSDLGHNTEVIQIRSLSLSPWNPEKELVLITPAGGFVCWLHGLSRDLSAWVV